MREGGNELRVEQMIVRKMEGRTKLDCEERGRSEECGRRGTFNVTVNNLRGTTCVPAPDISTNK